MKLNHKMLKKVIQEVIEEAAPASSTQLVKQARASETIKGIGSLTGRERKVLGALQNIQKALGQQGDQASAKVIRLVQLLVQELEGAQATAPDTQP